MNTFVGQTSHVGPAVEAHGDNLFGGGGAWAMQQFVAARMRGEQAGPQHLRTCDVLREDEWREISDDLIDETRLRLNGITDLTDRGLTRGISNAFGKTEYTWQDVSDMEPAQVSLDGTGRTGNQALNFGLSRLPLPMTFSDWFLSWRMMAASTEKGESLELHQSRLAARKVAERLELTLFQGGPTFDGLAMPGYTTHADRNTGSFSVGTWTGAGITGLVMHTDVLAMKQGLLDDGYNGPWGIYYPTAFETVLDLPYETTNSSNLSRRNFILDAVQGLEFMKLSDQMPADTLIMVTLEPDVVTLIDGEGVQAVQWEVAPMRVDFKVFLIQTPLIRSTQAGNSGIFHMT